MMLNNILSYQTQTSLFQSDFYGKFISKLVGKVVYKFKSFLIVDEGDFIYVGSITLNQLGKNFKDLSTLINFIKSNLNNNSKIIIDFQILIDNPITNELHLKLIELGFTPVNFYKIPRTRCLLDLSPTYQQVISKFYNKTLNDIERAIKKKVEIYEKWDVRYFYSLYLRTARKHQFNFIYDYNYFSLLCRSLKENSKGKLLFGKIKGMPMMVGSLIGEHNNVVYYLFTGSRVEYNSFSASSLIQFHIIQYAKANNFQFYDMMGIRNLEYGPSKFKMKFGGTIVRLMDTYSN